MTKLYVFLPGIALSAGWPSTADIPRLPAPAIINVLPAASSNAPVEPALLRVVVRMRPLWIAAPSAASAAPRSRKPVPDEYATTKPASSRNRATNSARAPTQLPFSSDTPAYGALPLNCGATVASPNSRQPSEPAGQSSRSWVRPSPPSSSGHSPNGSVKERHLYPIHLTCGASDAARLTTRFRVAFLQFTFAPTHGHDVLPGGPLIVRHARGTCPLHEARSAGASPRPGSRARLQPRGGAE